MVNFLRQVSNSRVHIKIVNPRVFKLVLQKRNENQRALGASSFMLGLKFVSISWTC